MEVSRDIHIHRVDTRIQRQHPSVFLWLCSAVAPVPTPAALGTNCRLAELSSRVISRNNHIVAQKMAALYWQERARSKSEI